MEKQNALNLIIEVLQNVLAGELKPESRIKANDVADAIVQKVEFSSSFAENDNKELFKKIQDLQTEADADLAKLDPDNKPEDKLLANFVKGKKEAYEEFLSLLKK